MVDLVGEGEELALGVVPEFIHNGAGQGVARPQMLASRVKVVEHTAVFSGDKVRDYAATAVTP
jgi:hypothetical protein